MAAEVTMPKLGMTMEEGKIVEWRKQEKEWVDKGEILLVIETDKVTYEVESQDSGFLFILIDSGEGIPVGTVLAYLAASEEEYARLKASAPGAAGPKAKAVPVSAEPVPSLVAESERAAISSGPVKATPGARKLAKEAGIDIAQVPGTGPEGRITRDDVQQFLVKAKAALEPAERPPMPAPPPVPEKGKRLWKSERMTGMRATIARRMMESLHGTAQMTALAQWDATNLLKLRKDINKLSDTLGYRATIPGMMVFLVARVLKEMPVFNASIEGNEIHYWEDVNIGVAVSVPDGLVVPVVHGADRLSLKEIQLRLADLIERARNKKLLPDDMSGGTFTISNLGSYGSEFETVILNPPEVALLGIGNAEKKPVVVEDQIVIREMMPVSLTFDHRLIDGAAAGAFRLRLRRLVENPGLLVTCSQFGF